MVGIVLVSHSRSLGEALVGLVQQVAVDKTPPIAVAAGVGPDRQEFGTDAAQIVEAIQSIYSPDGVLILMDLGSAILSAEMALDFLPEEMRPHICFCPAPFVEGAIAAGVQSSLGSDLEAVCREAEGALRSKAEQLGRAPAAPPLEPAPPPAPPGEIILLLKNEQGLHARPAARFAQTAAGFDADVRVRNLTNGKGPVSARSLISVISLGTVKGNRIGITATGPEADQALRALTHLVEGAFGEQ